MVLQSFRLLMLGLGPIALAACAGPGPAAAQATAAAPIVGIDLGSSSRIPQTAALARRGEGLRGAPAAATPTDHGSMPGMTQGSMGGMTMDHGSMPGISQGPKGGPKSGMPASQGSMQGMNHSAGGGTQMAQAGPAQGAGTINSVDAAARKVNITHGPIPGIGWPAMTMDFPVAPSVDLNAVTPGTRVNFQMQQGAGGMYVIQSIAPAGGGR